MKILLNKQEEVVGVVDDGIKVDDLKIVDKRYITKETIVKESIKPIIEKEIGNLEGKIIECAEMNVKYCKKTSGCEGCDIKEYTGDWDITNKFCLEKCNLDYIFKIVN